MKRLLRVTSISVLAIAAGLVITGVAHADNGSNQGTGNTVTMTAGTGHHVIAGDHHPVNSVTGLGHQSPVASVDNGASITPPWVCDDGTVVSSPGFCVE
ncbi:hypothetical protein ACTVZO_39730 [Streptomyces sp. IBSNAI002]|uniref:hypothetical protein n=1 Tax=Streptomyces sp. IBSNAI002 TaxID=3457500 RepID=UPI003FD314EB